MTVSINPLANTGKLTLQTIKESYGVDITTYKPLDKVSKPEAS
jgi:hypothetical protein